MEIKITKAQYKELMRRKKYPKSIKDLPSLKSVNEYYGCNRQRSRGEADIKWAVKN